MREVPRGAGIIADTDGAHHAFSFVHQVHHFRYLAIAVGVSHPHVEQVPVAVCSVRRSMLVQHFLNANDLVDVLNHW